jgi:hypothetical protein
LLNLPNTYIHTLYYIAYLDVKDEEKRKEDEQKKKDKEKHKNDDLSKRYEELRRRGVRLPAKAHSVMAKQNRSSNSSDFDIPNISLQDLEDFDEEL